MPTFYIDPAGNDSTGDGSTGNPWQTISKAHTSASSGDTIICKTSTTAYTWADQTFSKNLDIQGEQTPNFNPLTGLWEGSIFDGGGLSVQWSVSGAYTVTIKNLVFTNTASPADGGVFSNNLSGGTNVSFSFEKCVLYNVEVYGALGRGITYNANTSMTGCIIYDISLSSDPNFPALFGVDGNSPNPVVWTFINCVFYTDVSMIRVNNVAPDVEFTNCILERTVSGKFWSTNNVTPTWDIDNNCNVSASYTNLPSGSNNITSDPQLVDPANGNFNLRQVAPLFGAGVTP